MTKAFGFIIKLARQTGGKAGKGYNKTSTIQVVKDDCIVKQFRYTVDDAASFAQVSRKAIDYARDHEVTP